MRTHHKTIGQLIEESLEFHGIKSQAAALKLVRRVRSRSKLDDEQALALAQRHVRAVRKR